MVVDSSPRNCILAYLGFFVLYILVATDTSAGAFFLILLRADTESWILEYLMV